MSDEPADSMNDSIPLEDGPVTGMRIVHKCGAERDDSDTPLRGSRHQPRKGVENSEVCISIHDASGRIDHVDCPLQDISATGVAVVFDRDVTSGTRCYVSYRSVCQKPVHVGGIVRNCARLGPSRYRLGIQLDRRLHREEQTPAKRLPGRAVSPAHHGRKLRGGTSTDSPGNDDTNSTLGVPLVRMPSPPSDDGEYDLTGD